MKHWTMGMRSIGMTLGCMVVLTGCAFQGVHYKSLLQLREKSAMNYSQQVLETIVGVCDEARLPIFFSVELSTSLWNPTYSGSATAMVPALTAGQTNMTGGLLAAGETLNNQIQYKDFGSAAMSRVATLYNFLCFPLQYGNVVLPHGTFYTAVDTGSSRENFLMWAKRQNGQYVGVTPAKSEQFLQFAHDVTYWTQHATPDLRDLNSTTGQLYRFSIEYNTAIAHLINARLSRFKTEEAATRVREALKAKQPALDALKEEAKTSKVNPVVLQVLLQLESQELQAQAQTVAKLAAELDKLDSDIQSNTSTLGELEATLGESLAKLKTDDSDLATLDTDAILAAFRNNFDTLLTGDRKLEEAKVLTLPHAGGHKAQDSVDKLYRDRFLSLPQTVGPRGQ